MPFPDPNRKPLKLPILALVMILSLGVGLVLRWEFSGRSPRSANAGDEGDVDPRAMASGVAAISLGLAPGDEVGMVAESGRPGPRAHGEMLFLRFRYAGGEVSLNRKQRLHGMVKHQRSLMGKSGIYYRSLSEGGVVLADGVLPDPRRLHYSLPEGDGDPAAATSLHSGTLALAETEFVVRVPAFRESASLELFAVTPQDASLSRFACPENQLGSFSLANSIATPAHHEP